MKTVTANSTTKSLQAYRAALEDWKKRGGLDGLGGKYNPTLRAYTTAAKPTPQEFNIEGEFALRAAQMLHNQVITV